PRTFFKGQIGAGFSPIKIFQTDERRRDVVQRQVGVLLVAYLLERGAGIFQILERRFMFAQRIQRQRDVDTSNREIVFVVAFQKNTDAAFQGRTRFFDFPCAVQDGAE